jgi:hypothetical protein
VTRQDFRRAEPQAAAGALPNPDESGVLGKPTWGTAWAKPGGLHGRPQGLRSAGRPAGQQVQRCGAIRMVGATSRRRERGASAAILVNAKRDTNVITFHASRFTFSIPIRMALCHSGAGDDIRRQGSEVASPAAADAVRRCYQPGHLPDGAPPPRNGMPADAVSITSRTE